MSLLRRRRLNNCNTLIYREFDPNIARGFNVHQKKGHQLI